MLVRAVRLGYYGEARIREGVVFDMDESVYSVKKKVRVKDNLGNEKIEERIVHPSWVRPAGEEAAHEEFHIPGTKQAKQSKLGQHKQRLHQQSAGKKAPGQVDTNEKEPTGSQAVI